MQSSVSTSDTLSLRALVDYGASNNFVRLQSLARLDFEEVELPRSLLEVRLATGVVVRTEKRVVRARFSCEEKKFVDELIVLDARTLTAERVFRENCEPHQKTLRLDLRGSRSVTGDAAVSTVVDTQVEQEWPVTEGSDLGASAPGADAIGPNTKVRSAVRRRGRRGASAPGADAASSAGGCKRPAPEMLACSRAAGLHDEAMHNQARLDCGLQYRKMALESPPTLASELTSLPALSWKRFTPDLHDGRIEQIYILSDVERIESEAEELKQLVIEDADALSAKSKKERFDEQNWDSLKSSPLYEVLREYKDVLPDDIPAELPQDKGVQHEIDLVPGTKYCVTRQWPLPREQVKAIDDFFESRRKAGQVLKSKSPHSAPTFCVSRRHRAGGASFMLTIS
ncbi:unnamed protein product [Phytophthora fragariaefolia]|uniref:Unnamed protein product n=1 Tax=Phytophthora fragariaefolia TaxID=1490495 RepID=A0A9W6Y9C9_9STRA|nr:unnamed protein product [Phytophthora fragariaefolia]